MKNPSRAALDAALKRLFDAIPATKRRGLFNDMTMIERLALIATVAAPLLYQLADDPATSKTMSATQADVIDQMRAALEV